MFVQCQKTAYKNIVTYYKVLSILCALQWRVLKTAAGRNALVLRRKRPKLMNVVWDRSATWFALHKTDVTSRWPWYVPAENTELIFLTSNGFHEIFFGWVMSFSQLCMTKSSSKGLRVPVSSSFQNCKVHFLRAGVQFFTSSSSDRWICHAKLIETHLPSISSSPLVLAEIFNSVFSARTYRGQRFINLLSKTAKNREIRLLENGLLDSRELNWHIL